jgi:uncharacterized protein HemY
MSRPGLVRVAFSRTAAVVAVLAVALPAAADWMEIQRADAALDLESARAVALATVADDPRSADAVAAAGWWVRTLDHLPDPAAMLDVVDGPRDPELGWLLATLDAGLSGRAPSGCLASGEVAGPFGVLDTLDLERGAVPDDVELPPLGTRWSGPASPFRLTLRSVDGWQGPPELMVDRGVFLAAWTVQVAAPFDGWMVVEVDGGLNLEIDGQPVDTRRRAGVEDARTRWFSVRLEPGRHRLRAEIASRRVPAVRVGLLDAEGRPVDDVRVVDGDDGPWAPSTVTAMDPPAAAAVRGRTADGAPSVSDLLVAAQLAWDRGDPRTRRELLERAIDVAPDEPIAHLELAKLALGEGTGGSRESDLELAGEHIRQARAVPSATLVERVLAVREGREEDVERLLGELVDQHPRDVRVQQLWVREALRRGWTREAESGLEDLLATLPESRAVAELRLTVLASLERWEQHNALLRELARSEPPTGERIEALVGDCLSDEALAVILALRDRTDDPGVDAALVRLRVERGEHELALDALREARQRWGPVRTYDQLALLIAAGDGDRVDAVLDEALERTPTDLQLRTLAWRRGHERFWDPYRVEFDDVVNVWTGDTSDLDSILLLDQAVERIEADGSSIYYYHGISKALTPAGAQRASVLQPLPESYLLGVRVHKPDGSVVVPAELDASNGRIVLRDVKQGDLVEEEYVARVAATGASRRGHLPPYIYRFADTDRAFGLSEYVLIVPEEVDLKIDGWFEGLETSTVDGDGVRIRQWRAEQVPPVEQEPFGPPAQALLPWVSYGFNVTWHDVGDVIRDRALASMVITPEIREWATPRLVDDRPAKDVVQSLVDGLVDDVRPGRGVLSLNLSTGESFSAREGNRLGVLMAILADAGWDVDLVLSRPKPFAGTHLEVPSLDTFTSPVLRVARGDEELWVDLDEERRGVDYVGPILQASDGLVLPLADPHEPVSLLDRLPEFANPDLEERVRLVANVDEAGRADLEFDMELRGPQAERMLTQVREIPPDRIDQLWSQMASNLFPGAGSVRGRVDRTATGARLHLELDLDRACERTAGEMSCRSLVVARPLAPALASLPARTQPLELVLPLQQRVETEIRTPAGWTVLAPERRLERRWGSVDETVEPAPDGGVRSVLRVEVPAQSVAPDDYPEFARFCHALDELASRPPRLVRATD